MRLPAARALPFATSIVAALALAVALPGVVAAAVTGQQITALATTTYKMSCSPSGTDESCVRVGALPPTWTALITPASGPLTKLTTDASTGGPPNDLGSEPWMADMHGTACAAPKAASTFANKVWTSPPGTNLGPTTIGNCTTTGSVTASPFTGGPPFDYQIISIVHPPKATAKPTPKPTATPSPTPSLAPTAAPTVAPTASPMVSPTAQPTASPTLGPTVAPTATPAPTPVLGPIAVPTSTPSASSTPPPPAGGGAGAGPTFSSSVLALEDVNLDGAALGGSALLALLLLLFMGFPAELFNDTVEQNYDQISGWFKRGPLGRLRRLAGRLGSWSARHRRVGLVAFVGLAAIVSAFVDPELGPNVESLAEVLGFVAGLAIVLVSFKLPPMLAHRRRTGELGSLRPLPWALVIAALFVVVSRVAKLEPGYLYGIVLGALFTTEVPLREEGRETLFGSLWTLAAAVLGWIGLTWVRSMGLPDGDLFAIAAETAFGAILVLGLEATAFGLMPLRFLPGYAVYRFSKLAWGILFGLSVFAFLHLLIEPDAGYLDELTPAAFIAACGVFALFGGLSLATWGYFRVRRPKAVPVEEAGGSSA